MRGLLGAELLPEERAHPRDAHAHAVPLPQLAGRGHSGLHPAPAGLPQVSALGPWGSPAGGQRRWGVLGAALEKPGSKQHRSRGPGAGILTFSQPTSSSFIGRLTLTASKHRSAHLSTPVVQLRFCSLRSLLSPSPALFFSLPLCLAPLLHTSPWGGSPCF